jgi:hypothetical protein
MTSINSPLILRSSFAALTNSSSAFARLKHIQQRRGDSPLSTLTVYASLLFMISLVHFPESIGHGVPMQPPDSRVSRFKFFRECLAVGIVYRRPYGFTINHFFYKKFTVRLVLLARTIKNTVRIFS